MLERYADQVRLLMRVLPIIAKEDVFALKGGTAINLFYRDMPRLSVDIDLTYLPTEPFKESLSNIAQALDRIIDLTAKDAPELKIQKIAGGSNLPTKLMVSAGKVSIKVETSPVLRGSVFPPVTMQVKESVQDAFGFAEMSVLAFEDLYAGKIHAALDRQHPRDLFDILHLYENEGLTDDLFRVFLVYLASSSRPPHELLNPNFKDLDESYAKEFLGMTNDEVSIEALNQARARLADDVQSRLSGDIGSFLLSLHDAEPNFELIRLSAAANFPAISWKIDNLKKLKAINPEKHKAQREKLGALLKT